MLNPMLKDTVEHSMQDMVPTRISISRQIDPVKIEITTSSDAAKKRMTDYGSDVQNKKVHAYILENILTLKAGDFEPNEIQNDPVSPMHKVMLLMGCYGYPWDSGKGGSSIKGFMDLDIMRDPDTGEAFMVNLMLQALDDNSTQQILAQGAHDKSACSCLRDFANPSLMDVHKNDIVQKYGSCDTHLTYQHDSCSAQNLVDYAMDGTDGVSSGTDPEKEKMLLVTSMSASDKRLRNRVDPIVHEITAYEEQLLKADAAYASKALRTNTHLTTLVTNYCALVGYEGIMQANVEAILAEAMPTDLAGTGGLHSHKCPAAWHMLLSSPSTPAPSVPSPPARRLLHAGHNETASELLTVAHVLTEMKKWPASMHAYNKLRTPQFTTDDLTDNTKRYAASSAYPPKMDKRSFEVYIEKYRAAFQTCSRVGVPRYSTEITGYTNAGHWYATGELLLIFASSLSFFWSWIIYHQRLESPAHGFANMLNDFLAVIFSILAPLLSWVAAVIYSAKFLGDELEENFVHNSYGEFLTGFVVVWFFLYAVIFIFVLYLFVKSAYTLISFKGCCGANADVATAQLYDAVEAEALNPKPTPSAPAAKQSFFERSADRSAEYHKYFTAHMKSAPLLGLDKSMFVAQIALDLPVIIGLTFIAVATTLQRGVGDYNLILTVILLFTLLGITAHVTNVIRLLHLFVQPMYPKTHAAGAPAQVTSPHVQVIKYNRVGIGILLATVLYVFLHLAGLDAFHGHTHGALHQFLFAVAAFVILAVGDLSLEFFCIFIPQDFHDAHTYFYDAVFNKTKNTGWLILISLFFLHCHQMVALCRRTEPLPTRADVCDWFSP